MLSSDERVARLRRIREFVLSGDVPGFAVTDKGEFRADGVASGSVLDHSCDCTVVEYNTPPTNMSFHYHPSWEQCECVVGSGVYYINDGLALKAVEFSQGDVFEFARNAPHAFDFLEHTTLIVTWKPGLHLTTSDGTAYAHRR